jgi:two-component system response regulator (stage 0 sporulation protein F)
MATILIIDDEEPIRALLRTTLEAAGHTVVEAGNGRIGLDLYRFKPTDLIITDIAMPEMNGLDLILALTRQFLHAKVIAISGAGGEKNVLVSRNCLEHDGPFTSPLACRSCWPQCDTNWNISAAFPRRWF